MPVVLVLVLVVAAGLSGCAGGPEAVGTVPEQVDTPAPVADQPSSGVEPAPAEQPFTGTYMAGSMPELVTAIQNVLLDQSFNNEFTIEITRNFVVTAPVTLSQITRYYNKVITIRGNGGEKILALSTNGSLFTIANGLTLILDRDITLMGTNANNTALISVARGGELVLREGSKVTGNTNTIGEFDGGGVSVQTGGSLVMEGGDISGNESPFGGGVYMASMSFLDISGGSISDNSAIYHGGGVYITNGTAKLSGGAVSGNRVSSSSKSSTSGGAGFYISGGNLTITGGEIDGNVSSSALGGGVHLTGTAVCTMTGGSISNNSVTASGGGIYLFNAELNISGGTISGNQTTASNGNGGGIYITQSNSSNKTTITMTGGIITNNSASSGGAIYAGNSWYYSGNAEYSYGTLVTMRGGAISGNKAVKGGGVYLSQNNFIMSGKSLINSNNADEGSGVYVQQAVITLSEGARIDLDNTVCLNYPARTGQSGHQSAIYITGEIPGYDGVAKIELRGSSNVTDAAQWDQKILMRSSGYSGGLPTTRFTLDRFIPAAVTNANPIVSISDYQVNDEGDLVRK
jgi:hypothetical protein